MGGEENVQPPHNRGGGGHHFPVGSIVEVRVNEENMGCVYFSATVVPPPLFSRKSSTKNPGETLYVKYQNSVARKNGSDPLHEYVDVSSVRPALPLLQKAAAKRLELNDVVDAFHNNRWCEGVVSRVVGGGERFVVMFENPSDELEFGPSALRAHWDWADGVWAGPKRKGKIGNPAFEAGAKVEIWLKGAWFPAAVVRDLGNGAYLVEFKDINGGSVEAEVDSLHVRPCPPNFRERKFENGEKVGGFFDCGWWSGLIKEKVDRNAYIVFFEHTNLNRLLRLPELRPHMDWRDGKWFVGTSKSEGALEKQNPQIEHANQETELQIVEDDVVDQERRSNQKEDHIRRRTPSPIDDLTLRQFTSNSKRRRKSRALKKHKPPSDDANHEIEQSIKPPNENANQEIEKVISSHEFDQESINENANQEIEKIIGSHPNVTANQDIEKIIGSQELNQVSSEQQGWPFTKRSVVWEFVDSMEVFRKMPQRPHFEPLRSCKEHEREGRAIGCMVTFSNLVETARSLKLSDPKSLVDELYETLLDLEGQGFEAGAVRELVVKLVAAKEEEQRLVDQAKRIKDEIEERRCRKSKIEGEMREINEHIRKLREKLGLSETARAKEVEGIADLQAGLEESQQKIECLRCGIEGVAASVFHL
ncbi:DUF724 domain-containing protein 6-like [Salvia miltiorrhiza]|uniref:DUF724 domain-containing protein 6-like n=1 Tax=Salvia miltiorrhiza TaxID=226208 RepID=UPI0025AD1A4E|nr:DUF724 domain-containing protein 6-like [Salvia miltiorrhiza]